MQENTTRPAEEFCVRAVAAADNSALAGVLREVMEEFGAAGAGSSIHDPELQDMASAYAAAGSAYFVVEHEGRLVGGGGFGPLAGGAPEVCELRKMYLRPEARGHGLGRAMLARCLETARQIGYRRMYLETRQNMSDARRLYERSGFAPVSKPLGQTGHFGCDAWYVRDL
jgi:putative acetyltransferase